MKKLFVTLGVLLTCFLTMAAAACGSGSGGLKFKLNQTKDGYVVTGIGDCQDTDVVIPEIYKDLPVTTIGSSAFMGCKGLTSVEIPNSVTEIWDYAFAFCSNLRSIGIPNSVASIGDNAFKGCTGLTNIEIPNSVTVIEQWTFWDCTGLTSIEIPNSVTEIGYGAFEDCTGLTSVTIGSGVTSIGNYAFYGCTGLTSIEIPNSVTSIGNSTFSSCPKLIEVWNHSQLDIQKGSSDFGQIAEYAEYVYEGDEQSKQTRTDEGFIFYEDKEIFLLGYSGKKTEIRLPDSSPSGKPYAIYPYAFFGCEKLADFEIPDSVTEVGRQAFYNTAYYNDKANWDNDGVLYLDNHLIEAKNTLSEAYSIKQGTKMIAENAFRGCKNLTSIEIPNSVTSIGKYTFAYCTGLTSVEIPNNVTSIGWGTFYGCNINKITIPFVGNGFDEMQFGYIFGVRFSEEIYHYVEYPNFPFTGEALWTSFTGVAQVTITGGSTIGNRAFLGCTSLTSIEIPDSVTSIGEFAFEGCTGLTSIEIPNSVTSIGAGAFCECRNLTSVEIPNSVTSIEDWAFCECRNLTSVEIPNSVTSIGDKVFMGCTNLTSVEIPNSVIAIGEFAFAGCWLTSINFKGTTQQWKELKKSSRWRSSSAIEEVVCNDGSLKGDDMDINIE